MMPSADLHESLLRADDPAGTPELPLREVREQPLPESQERLSPRYMPVCRFCGLRLERVMIDLGMQPVANAYRSAEDLMRMEQTFPLRALVCEACLLVQIQAFETCDVLFGQDYPYFSSFSRSMLDHARDYASKAVARFGLNSRSLVVEVGCNDGYLLRWFRDDGIPVLGVEPTISTAQAAQRLGIDVEPMFFGRRLAARLVQEGRSADLIPANNVVAHVPDINDFIGGFSILLKPQGVASFEFHHVLNLLSRRQFDTVYHEHYYYHSLGTFTQILARHHLQVFDVEKVTTHGGSLRVYAQHADTGRQAVSPAVTGVLEEERAAGLHTLAPYMELESDVRRMKRQLLAFLIEAKDQGKSIAAYGAPAKANTLLNYAGIGPDFIDYTVDLNPHKQNRFLPGTLIPIHAPEHVFQTRPDYLLILVWNLTDEVRAQMAGIREWGGQFVTLIPEVTVS